MWFGKAIDDFNAGIEALGGDAPAIVAGTGNGFTSMFSQTGMCFVLIYDSI